MIRFPTNLDQIQTTGVFRAGGTDVQARINSGILIDPDIISLRDLNDLVGVVAMDDGGFQIGAMTRIQDAADALQDKGYQALVEAFHGLATPAIRRIATVAGNLFQDIRCPYYRMGQSCVHTSGEGCQAQHATTAHFSAIETSGCLAVHPSTCALALLAYQATVQWADGTRQPLQTALQQSSGKLCVAIILPPSTEQTGAWLRISSRAHAEWPLIEAVYSKRVTNGTMVFGAVAPQPMIVEFTQHTELQSQISQWKFRASMNYKQQLINAAITELINRVEGT